MSQLRKILLFLTALCVCSSVSAQEKISAEDQTKLDEAQRIAEQFVERFRQTRDFKTVWKEFHSSDTSCAMRLTLGFEDRLLTMKLDEKLLEQFYLSVWNTSLLSQAYYYSIAPSINGSEPNEKVLEKLSSEPETKRFTTLYRQYLKAMGVEKNGKGKPEPKTAQEFRRIIVDSDHLAARFRKSIPKDVLQTSYWESAKIWFNNAHNVGRISDRKRFSTWCGSGSGRLYVAQVGFFVLVFVEESGKLKLYTMSFIDD